ncbi:MAG: peptidylprolyl isomerase [Planctomycetota bacterium]|jgi:cyclophilin family peptidyl-prolyl cis-trans isomerase
MHHAKMKYWLSVCGMVVACLVLAATPTQAQLALSGPIDHLIVQENLGSSQVNLNDFIFDADVPHTDSVYAFRSNLTNVADPTFYVHMFDEDAPLTVDNFQVYADGGYYDNSFIHRVSPNFVVQGGEAFVDYPGGTPTLATIPSFDPVLNEFSPERSNLRGTIAMARVGGQVNSATNNWFINWKDNTFLDTVDEGFTVFGEVMGNGMDVVDEINLTPLGNLGYTTAPDGTPIQNYDPDVGLLVSNLVLFSTIEEVQNITYEVIENTAQDLISDISFDENGVATIDYIPDAIGQGTVTVRATNVLGDTLNASFDITVLGDPGDVNLDSTVDITDVLALTDAINANNQAVQFDNVINVSDLINWAETFGQSAVETLVASSGAVAIPEPSTAILLLAGPALLTRRRKR